MRMNRPLALLAGGLGLLLLVLVAVSLMQGRTTDAITQYEAHPGAAATGQL